MTEDIALSLKDSISRMRLPDLTKAEHDRMRIVTQSATMAANHQSAVDTKGMRFLLFFQQHVLQGTPEVSLSWRDFVWAYHSASQDILVDLISRHYQGKLIWEDAKERGLFMWMTDPAALVSLFSSYQAIKSDDRNSELNSRSSHETNTQSQTTRTPSNAVYTTSLFARSPSSSAYGEWQYLTKNKEPPRNSSATTSPTHAGRQLH